MHRFPPNTVVIRDNRLIKIWQLPDGRKRIMGKRVVDNYPLTWLERRAYVAAGDKEAAVKFITRQRQCTLAKALELFNLAAYGTTQLTLKHL
jgi:hypothetical protein